MGDGLMSTKPGAWTLSPQLTAAPELWRGCVLMIPFFETPSMDIVTGTKLSEGSLSGGGISTRQGRAAKVTEGTGWNYRMTLTEKQRSTPQGRHTIVWYGRIPPGRTDMRLVGLGNGNRWVSYNSGENQFVPQWDDASDKIAVVSNMFPDDGQFHQLTGRQTKVSGSEVYQAIVNGEVKGQEAIASRFDIDDVENNLEIGGTAWNDAENTESECLFFALWDRDLSEEELKHMYFDPFAMLRPAGF